MSESHKVLTLLQTSLFSWVNRYLYCSLYVLVLGDISFLTLFSVVVVDVLSMDVCWAGYSSFCFCNLPFVLASFAHRFGVEGLPRCSQKFQPGGVAFCCLPDKKQTSSPNFNLQECTACRELGHVVELTMKSCSCQHAYKQSCVTHMVYQTRFW